jgi:predicted  nucleic acid-binding Zn-ribbon protein
LQEIDTAKRQIDQVEEQALASIERSEEAQRQLQEQQGSFKELDERYNTELEKWEAQKPEVARKASDLRQLAEDLKGKLAPQTLALFQRIRQHYDGQALAEVLPIDRKGPRTWHCGACNYRVRPQAVVAIQTQGAIEACDSCKRILYLPEATH